MSKKFIIYGFLKPNCTHHFIHLAIEKAAKYLNYETYWLDNTHRLDTTFFDNSIIFTEGWETDNLPIAKNSVYIIHHFGNKPTGRYNHNIKYIINKNKVFDLRFLCESFEDHNQKWNVEFKNLYKVDLCTYTELANGYSFIYQPWATDLLPEEINYDDVYIQKEKNVYYLGTVSDGWHNDIIPQWKLNNKNAIEDFKRACKENDINFIINNPIENPLTINQCKILSQKSYLSPDIRDIHKLESNYIPCRVFKNISYGNLGLTNSKATFDFFNQEITYHCDPYKLFYKGEEEKHNIKKIINMMSFVKNNHTYVNRLNTLTKIINE
jgi:hypothetical protein